MLVQTQSESRTKSTPDASVHEFEPDEELRSDPRWALVERIAATIEFQKSSRLQALLKYLARCTINGDRNGLGEQNIGRAVFAKGADYSTLEDSSVRVYVRQLRGRLRDFHTMYGNDESLIVDLPKGGYALSFSPNSKQVSASDEGSASNLQVPAASKGVAWLYVLIGVLSLLSMGLAAGWFHAASVQRHANIPWPLDRLVGEKAHATVVLADVGYALRLLGDRPVPLAEYMDRSFIKRVMPDNPPAGVARLLRYLAVSQTTSVADARAAASFSELAGPFAQNLSIRSARDLSPNDLAQGNFIFVGAHTSNPWVELFDDMLNFHIVENPGYGGTRYILNGSPQAGEQQQYAVPGLTGTSGQDYASISLLPNRTGKGSILLIQGMRMEGTEAAVYLLRTEELRAKLRTKLDLANGGHTPEFFEALLLAKSVSGAPVSVEVVAVRILHS